MPYITPQLRIAIDSHLDQFMTQLEHHIELTHPGNLNYIITSILDKAHARNNLIGYTNYNAMIGILECAKLELYRRCAAPYEDIKQIENGDAYHHLKHTKS